MSSICGREHAFCDRSPPVYPIILHFPRLVKHPAFDEIRGDKSAYRVVGDLKMTDFVMNNGFWIGVYPGMTQDMLQHMINTIKEFCIEHAK